MRTTKQVADILKVHQKTVTRWILAGKITAFRTPGGHWRIPDGAIDKLREDQT